MCSTVQEQITTCGQNAIVKIGERTNIRPQKWRKLNMSKGQELEDLSAKHHLPQKARNQRTTLIVIEEK